MSGPGGEAVGRRIPACSHSQVSAADGIARHRPADIAIAESRFLVLSGAAQCESPAESSRRKHCHDRSKTVCLSAREFLSKHRFHVAYAAKMARNAVPATATSFLSNLNARDLSVVTAPCEHHPTAPHLAAAPDFGAHAGLKLSKEHPMAPSICSERIRLSFPVRTQSRQWRNRSFERVVQHQEQRLGRDRIGPEELHARRPL